MANGSPRPDDALAFYLRQQEDVLKEAVRQINEQKRTIAALTSRVEALEAEVFP